MNRDLFDALEEGIKLMEAGIPLEDCLKKYPEIAPELRELLKTAAVMKDLRVENIPVEQMYQNRKKLLAHAESLRLGNYPVVGSSAFEWLRNPIKYFMHSLKQLSPVAGRLVLALGLAGLFIFLSGGLLITSAKSLPGDSLYPVKIAVEDIKVYLAPSGEVRHEYEDGYQQQRVDEVVKLIGLMREQQISFEGIIISMDASQWNVSGIPVNIQSDSTTISGVDKIDAIEPGMRIEVEGKTSSQGSVLADEIHLREYQYNGIVEKISQDAWQVSGTPLLITSSTQIDHGVKVGDEVTVLIRSEDNGQFALDILRELHPQATPTIIKPIEIISTEITQKAIEEPTIQNTELHILQGIVDQIGGSYWIINGDLIYIAKETLFEDGINIGDKITVLYKVEQNGTFTAIEINRGDKAGELEEKIIQETPVGTSEGEEHGSTYEPTSEEPESKEGSEHKEEEETPEPTEVHDEHH